MISNFVGDWSSDSNWVSSLILIIWWIPVNNSRRGIESDEVSVICNYRNVAASLSYSHWVYNIRLSTTSRVWCEIIYIYTLLGLPNIIYLRIWSGRRTN